MLTFYLHKNATKFDPSQKAPCINFQTYTHVRKIGRALRALRAVLAGPPADAAKVCRGEEGGKGLQCELVVGIPCGAVLSPGVPHA